MSQFPNIVLNNNVAGVNVGDIISKVKEEVYPEVMKFAENSVKVTATLAKKINNDIEDVCQYQDSDVNCKEMYDLIEHNYDNHGVSHAYIEKRKIRKEELQKFEQNGGKHDEDIDYDDLRALRGDLNVKTCCFVDKIDLSKFIKIYIPANIKVSAL